MIEDADHNEARQTISKLVPFLVDRKAKTLYPTLSATVTDIWSRFDPVSISQFLLMTSTYRTQGKMTAQSLSVLLRDTAHLLLPSQVIVLPPQTDTPEPVSLNLEESFLGAHPSSTAILALSDLSKLFETVRPSQLQTDNSTNATVPNHITLKLTFYAAHILSTPIAILTTLADELMARSRKVETEAVLVTGAVDTERPLTKHRPSTVPDCGTTSLIEDISTAQEVRSSVDIADIF